MELTNLGLRKEVCSFGLSEHLDWTSSSANTMTVTMSIILGNFPFTIVFTGGKNELGQLDLFL